MPNKYYTPTLDEFRQGFIYETLNTDNVWMSHTYMLGTYLPEDLLKVRVRYLNESDLQFLGFVFNGDLGTTKSYYKNADIVGRTVYLYVEYIMDRAFIDLAKDVDDLDVERLINGLQINNINELAWILNRYGI